MTVTAQRQGPRLSDAVGRIVNGLRQALRRGDETSPFAIDDVLSQTDVARLQSIRSSLDITSNNQLRRNVAFGEGHVDGVELGEIVGVSGARGPGIDIPENRIFQTGVDRHPRHLDSEVFVLENIARRLTPQSTGNIRLISERTVCNSCEDVINQFREMFPNINLVVRAGE